MVMLCGSLVDFMVFRSIFIRQLVCLAYQSFNFLCSLRFTADVIRNE